MWQKKTIFKIAQRSRIILGKCIGMRKGGFFASAKLGQWIRFVPFLTKIKHGIHVRKKIKLHSIIIRTKIYTRRPDYSRLKFSENAGILKIWRRRYRRPRLYRYYGIMIPELGWENIIKQTNYVPL